MASLPRPDLLVHPGHFPLLYRFPGPRIAACQLHTTRGGGSAIQQQHVASAHISRDIPRRIGDRWPRRRRSREQERRFSVCSAHSEEAARIPPDVAAAGIAHSQGGSEHSAAEPMKRGSRSEGDKGGSVLGAVALITGTSVGAGVLALPAETGPGGFWPSATLLVLSWAFLAVEAFLIADVNISIMDRRQKAATRAADSSRAESGVKAEAGIRAEQHGAQDSAEYISLQTMAEETLGPLGGLFSTATYVFISFTLLVAYIAKGAEVLTINIDMPFEVAAAGFATLLGGVLYAGSTETTDWVNRVMTGVLLGLFVLIVGGGLLCSDFSALQVQDWSQSPSMLPIIFLSLVFHDLIPVLCTYLNGDRARVRRAIALGSAVPLAMFLVWEAVALSIGGGWSGGDPIDTLRSLGGPTQAAVVEAFSLLAVMTSFLGTALSMAEFFQEQLLAVFGRTSAETAPPPNAPQKQRKPEEAPQEQAPAWHLPAVPNEHLRAAAFLLVLVPSLAMSTTVPDAFFTASEAAGAYGMTVLYGIFPPLMFWKLRQQEKQHAPPPAPAEWAAESLWDKPAGGIALASMAACSFSIMATQAVIDTASFQDTVAGSSPSSPSLLVLASSTPVADNALRGEHKAPSVHVGGGPSPPSDPLCSSSLLEADSCPSLSA